MTESKENFPTPSSPFALLPLRTGVLFPHTNLSLRVGRRQSLALFAHHHEGDIIGLVSQFDPTIIEPGQEDLCEIGCFGRIRSIVPGKNNSYDISVEGLQRFSRGDLEHSDAFLLVHGEALADRSSDSDEATLLGHALREKLRELVGNSGGALVDLTQSEMNPGAFADNVAAGLGLSTKDAIAVLSEIDVPARLRRVLELLGRAAVQSELRQKIEEDVRRTFGKQQRDAVLRQQLRSIRKELGESNEDEDEEDEFDQLKHRLDEANLPQDAQKIADRELKRLKSATGQGPEANVIRNYLDCLADLPWSKKAEQEIDIESIATKLDADHFGLEDVKTRILEHFAVRKLSDNSKGTILCFVGPPGVGKTSLGQSIADATGRPFVRIALGGIRDEAEIRGHRRTYVAAIPGRLIHGIRKAGVKNPIILLDEIDKLGHDWGGSPEAALLEVLDPEQNRHFTDHYLETPFDLSEAFFICTANGLDSISAPLRDRMEIVEISGYTHREKLNIGTKHLLSKRIQQSGLSDAQLQIEPGAITQIISDYTREAGVRQLDREIGRLCRSVALEVVRQTEQSDKKYVVDADDVAKYLGKPRFSAELSERSHIAGVATGLAWTPFGGSILYIETSRMPGKGRLEITGQLGDVMKESARAALSYVRSHADDLKISDLDLDRFDLHIHIPAGAVPKDGPSAGITIFTALTSLLTNRPIRPDTAMTGECTLRGRVLAVGGIKAKILAAHRANIVRVILPRDNERDLEDVPQDVCDEMEFILVNDMAEALEAALENESVETGKLISSPPPIEEVGDIGEVLS